MTHPTPNQVKDFAAKLAASAKLASLDSKTLYTYEDETGAPLYWRVRADCHATGDKFIRPFYWTGTAFESKEPPAPPEGKPLYGLQRLAIKPAAVVIVCEGEKATDALNRYFKQCEASGVLAVTSGGASSAGAANWQPLNGRACFVFPDHDKAGAKYAHEVIAALQGIAASAAVLDISGLGLPPKGDAVEWLAAGGDIDGLMMLIDATRSPKAALDDALIVSSETQQEQMVGGDGEQLNTPDEEKISQASALVDFVLDRAEIFHNSNKDVFATDNETKETRRIDSRAFKDWVLAGFYKSTGKSARAQSVSEALGTLGGLGRNEDEEHEAHLRIAGSNGVYFIDLAEPQRNRVIKIEAGKWELITNSPIRFIRTESMQPLPVPEKGGDITLLWKIANIPPADRQLVIAWLCECMRPDTPFPVLELLGEQGSAKSTTQSALRNLIDPNACNLRGAPKGVEDVYVGAGANWLVSFENISHLPAPIQDAFCTIATGGGYAKRKLYSDADESVIKVKQPIVINGISAAITAQDLIDRTLTIETPTITARTECGDLWRDFNDDQAKIFGGILDAMAAALQLLPSITLAPEDRPRLAEFVRFGMAIAECTGGNQADFLRHFNECRKESIARTIDASPAATALLDWFEARNKRECVISVKDLFNELDKYKPQGADGWIKSAKGLGDAMRRAAPALRTLGMECKSLGKVGGSCRWKISSYENSARFIYPNEVLNVLSPDDCLKNEQKIPKEQDLGLAGLENDEFISHLSPTDKNPDFVEYEI